MTAQQYWSILGIEKTRDVATIRRAYAVKLRGANPEDDPAAFQALREAYEWALQFATTPPGRPKEAVRSSSAEAVPEVLNPADAPAVKDYVAKLRHVEALLDSDCSKEALTDAFSALIQSPSLEQVDVHTAVEQTIALLILQHMPQSDPLVDPAIDAFGWKTRRERMSAPSPADEVLKRKNDLTFLDDMTTTWHEFNYAYTILKKNDVPRHRVWSLGYWISVSGVRKLLQKIAEEHPTLDRNFDPGVLAWWRENVSRPQLSAESLGMLAVLGFSISFVTMVNNVGLDGVSKAFIAVSAGVLTASVAGAAYLYGLLWPRHLWQTQWRWRAGLATRVGWLAAGGALVFFSAIVVPGWISSLVLAAAAGAILCWLLVVGDKPWHATVRGRVPIVLHDLCVAGWWYAMMFALPSAVYLQMTPAVVVLWIAGIFGDGYLRELYWASAASTQRLFVVVGGLVGMTLAVLVLSKLLGGMEPARPILAAAFASLAVLQRPAGVLLGAQAARLRFYVMLLAALIGFTSRLKEPSSIFFGAMLWGSLNFAQVLVASAVASLFRRARR